MKKLLIALNLLVLFGCVNKKSVLLPEIQNATITEITDVSPAYIFYDKTKPDSLELNKGNLIISTNWLVNVDKRLTLKQVIPSIIKLQDKKRNSSHKKESARNYYSCNDVSIKNLGFIDFTDVIYLVNNEEVRKDIKNNYDFLVTGPENGLMSINLEIDNLHKNYKIDEIESVFKQGFLAEIENKTISFTFIQELTFQDYITFKSKLSQLNLENTIINNEEYIIN